MNGANYPLVAILILFMIVSFNYSNKKKNKIDKQLKLLEFDFESQFKISGKVTFSKLHILLDCYLTILYSENDLLIYGYDNYSHRKTKFIFHTPTIISSIEDINIPKYSILDIKFKKDNEILINGENDSLITLRYVNYGKEKPQLKDANFVELLRKLNK